MKTTKYLIYSVIILAGVWLVSCSEMDAYKDLFEAGEITYPGKINSVDVFPGKNRAQLKLVMGSDPFVTKVRAYWNSKNDSAEISVTPVTESDTVYMLIDNLNEGQVNFDLYTLDNKGNISVVTNASVDVYGEVYENALLNRPLSSAACGTIKWGAASAGMLGVEVSYTDGNGTAKTLNVANNESVTLMADFEEASDVFYRTKYLPHPMAIDTFYAAQEEIQFTNSILTTGTYAVISENTTAHAWMPGAGETREVTQVNENEFSFILTTAASNPVPVLIKVDPDTKKTSLELQEIGNFGAPWFMTAKTIESEENYVSACDGIISIHVHFDNLDLNNYWGDLVVKLQKK